MAFLCPARIRKGKSKSGVRQLDAPLPRRITGSDSIDTLVRVGLEKERGSQTQMVVVHDFKPCVDDELAVKAGQHVHVLYQENDWLYVISDNGNEGFIPYTYCLPHQRSVDDFVLPRKHLRNSCIETASSQKQHSSSPLHRNTSFSLPDIASACSDPDPSRDRRPVAQKPNQHSHSCQANAKLTSHKAAFPYHRTLHEQTKPTGFSKQHNQSHNQILQPSHKSGHISSYNSRRNPSHPIEKWNHNQGYNSSYNLGHNSSHNPTDTSKSPTYYNLSTDRIPLISRSNDHLGPSIDHHHVRKHQKPTSHQTISYQDQHPIEVTGSLDGSRVSSSQPSIVSSTESLTETFQKVNHGRYIVLYQFIAREENDLSVERGEFATVLNKDDPDWYWIKRKDQREGFVPSSFLILAEASSSSDGQNKLRYKGLTDIAPRPPGPYTRLVCLYDYKAQTPADLSVTRGEWLYADIEKQTDPEWLEVYSVQAKKTGFIPRSYAKPPNFGGDYSIPSNSFCDIYLSP